MQILALVLGAPCAVLSGQSRPDSLRAQCPTQGIVASVAPADSASRSASRVPRSNPGGAGLIDTTWRFDIALRQWSRPYFAASIGAGWTGDETAAGTTSAPDAASKAKVCAGVAIDMRAPTLVLKGARGAVHLRADARALTGAGRRAAGDSTRQPRR
jgi:hypothetical protein